MPSDDADRIRVYLEKGFESELFEAALRNLGDSRNSLRFNNFAYAARETLRHVMHRLAPDSKIVRCSWYAHETGKPGGVTRKQRAYYAIQGGLSDEFVKESLELDTDDALRSLGTQHEVLNKFTHIQPERFGLPDQEIEGLAAELLHAIGDVLTAIGECRARVLDRLASEIDSAAIDGVFKETIISIDELANHHSIQDVYVESAQIVGINEEFIHIEAKGSISCILQYGSNSDLRRGDGAEIARSFKFSCDVQCPVDEPGEIAAVEDSLFVDTRAWREARFGGDDEY